MNESFDRIVRTKIVDGPYALFWCAGEGSFMPNGEEEASGYAVVPDGSVWSWWTGWDADRQRVVFTIWEPVEPESDWDGEYAEALAELAAAAAEPR